MAVKYTIDQFKDRMTCPISITRTGKKPAKATKSTSTKKRGK